MNNHSSFRSLVPSFHPSFLPPFLSLSFLLSSLSSLLHSFMTISLDMNSFVAIHTYSWSYYSVTLSLICEWSRMFRVLLSFIINLFPLCTQFVMRWKCWARWWLVRRWTTSTATLVSSGGHSPARTRWDGWVASSSVIIVTLWLVMTIVRCNHYIDGDYHVKYFFIPFKGKREFFIPFEGKRKCHT